MTGRELILYILENGLENDVIFKDGHLVGHLTVEEAAIKYGFGKATIYAWIWEGLIEAHMVGNRYYIPANFAPPTTKTERG